MRVILAAAGGGLPGSMTQECRDAVQEAACLIGAPRLLADLPEHGAARRVAATRPQEILDTVRTVSEGTCVVLYSGDTGLYSGARLLVPLLSREHIACTVLPGVSSVQLFAAAIQRPWQDWLIVSAHGVSCSPVGAVMQGKPVFFLTGTGQGPAELCRELAQAGLGTLRVTVGEELGRPGQRVTEGTAAEIARQAFSPLSVLLAEPAPATVRRAPGFPDSFFVRGEVPMTKRDVRAAILARLAPNPSDVLWDVGAGTGSVSVELALAAPWGRTYAIECEEKAIDLIRANREKLGAWNLRPVHGKAPQALEPLEAPDGAFLGGTKGSMAEIVDRILSRNPRAKLCISAICVETLGRAVDALKAHGIEPEITQVSVCGARAVGSLHMLTAQNPVFLIAGNCDA